MLDCFGSVYQDWDFHDKNGLFVAEHDSGKWLLHIDTRHDPEFVLNLYPVEDGRVIGIPRMTWKSTVEQLLSDFIVTLVNMHTHQG